MKISTDIYDNKMPYRVKIKHHLSISRDIRSIIEKEKECMEWICKRYNEKLGDCHIGTRYYNWDRKTINISDSIFIFDDKNIATEFLLIYG